MKVARGQPGAQLLKVGKRDLWTVFAAFQVLSPNQLKLDARTEFEWASPPETPAEFATLLA